MLGVEVAKMILTDKANEEIATYVTDELEKYVAEAEGTEEQKALIADTATELERRYYDALGVTYHER